MIITGSNLVISQIRLRGQEKRYLLDLNDLALLDARESLLYSEPPSKIVAIYKGNNLIWLTTYQIDIKSCYGSGTWLDNYSWIDSDIWKDS